MPKGRNEAMLEVSDEMLMAYADRELDAATSARVMEVVGNDPTLLAKLRVFEQTRDVVGVAFDQVLNEPVPERLSRLLVPVPVSGVRHTDNGRARSGLWEDFRRWLGSGSSFAPALAAAAVAIVAVAGGWGLKTWTSPEMAPGAGMVLADGTAGGLLHKALETEGLDQSVTEDGAGTVTPRFTFKDKAGRYCRQYTMETAAANEFVGVACRKTGGGWILEIQTAVAGNSGTFTPAGDSPEITSKVGSMIEGEFLDSAEDAALIAKGWQ